MTSYDPFRGTPSGEVEKAEAKANAVPTGTVPEILGWVGDDKEKARRALEAEEANAKPRKSLVKDLKDLLDD